ncbi:hypothetical protein MGWOODY_Smn1238 [hydrothermal vent metagenome]|uniref:Uncharacterized protein n=1 Tax=hydrothermal vent metagenome TaxID=652676 RepID=A0A160TIZ3_9ZZZZ
MPGGILAHHTHDPAQHQSRLEGIAAQISTVPTDEGDR